MARENTLSVSFFLQPVGFSLPQANESEYEPDHERQSCTDILIPSSLFGFNQKKNSNEGKSE